MKTLVLVLAALMSVACSHSKANPPPLNQLSPDIIREARDSDLDSPRVFAALQKMTAKTHGVLPEMGVLSGREKTSERSLNAAGKQWNAVAKSKCRAGKDIKSLASGKDSSYETYTLKGAQCPVDYTSTTQMQADLEQANGVANGSASFQLRETAQITSPELRKASGITSSTMSIDGSGVLTDYNPTSKTGSVWSRGAGVMTNETSIGQIKVDLKIETYKNGSKADMALVGVAHFGNESASFSLLRLDGQTTFRLAGRLSTPEEFSKIFNANLVKIKTL